MAAGVEEIIVDADVGAAKKLAPDFRQTALCRTAGRSGGRCPGPLRDCCAGADGGLAAPVERQLSRYIGECGCRAARRESCEQDRQVGCDGVNRLAIDAGGIGDEPQDQFLSGARGNRQRVIRRLGSVNGEQPGVAAELTDRRVDLVVLEHDQAVEQAIVPGYFTDALDRVEGRVLMLIEVELLFLQPAEPAVQGGIGRQCNANRNVGDAGTDQSLDAVDVVRPTGKRRAEHHVGGIRIVRQQESPRSLHEGARRAFGRQRERAQILCQFMWQANDGFSRLRSRCADAW